jgi:hypothetical protein
VGEVVFEKDPVGSDLVNQGPRRDLLELLGIVELEELLRAEAADIGLHDHRPDAHFVHVLEICLGVVSSRMHLA